MWGGYHGGRTSRAPKRPPIQKSTPWRTLTKLQITTQAEPGGEFICELGARTTVEVTEQVPLPMSGEMRACIIDPVWKGYLTTRSVTGEALCEPLDDDSAFGGHRLQAAPPATPAPLVEQLTMAQLSDLQAECMADDIDIEDAMLYWTEEEARLCFETGGASRPLRPPPRLPSSHAESQAAPEEAAPSAPAAADAAPPAPASAGPVEMTARDLAARAAGEWRKGKMVLLQGLSAESELNGRSGVVAAWDAERARYDVRLANRVVRALPANLAIHPLQRLRDANEANRGDEVVLP